MGKVSWSHKAAIHLETIHDYIASDSPFYAKRFVRGLIRSTRKLEELPRCGRQVPELPGQGIREVIHKGYRIIYRIRSSDDIEVLAVLHGSRDFLSSFGS